MTYWLPQLLINLYRSDPFLKIISTYGTTEAQHHMSWFARDWIIAKRGCGTHFTLEYLALQVLQQYSQAKWVPRLFTRQLLNHEQIDSCVRLQCCPLAWMYYQAIVSYYHSYFHLLDSYFLYHTIIHKLWVFENFIYTLQLQSNSIFL